MVSLLLDFSYSRALYLSVRIYYYSVHDAIFFDDRIPGIPDGSVERPVRCEDEFFFLGLSDVPILGFGQSDHLLFTCIFSRCEKKLFVVGRLLQVLYFLLAVQHLPALDAQDFAVGLGLYHFEFLDEFLPFGGAQFEHSKTLYIESFNLGII